jgi:hypothetical protein
MHPPIRLVDDRGDPVVRTGRPVSTLSCGSASGCHDVAWIARHDYHGAGRHAAHRPDCFLCHEPRASNDARVREVVAGRSEWAATAALLDTGIVKRDGEHLRYDARAFDADGFVAPDRLDLGRPSARACGLCHGLVHEGGEVISSASFGPASRGAENEGLVFSAERINVSALNLAGKDELSRPWDVHAERLLTCANCHFSPNHPAYSFAGRAPSPGHLRFDARRIEIDEYLRRPDHDLARGATLRRCEQCHDAPAAHGFLPRAERHFAALLCESCHVPAAYAPARSETDWTMLARPGEARVAYRGTRGPLEDPKAAQGGYRPVLLPRKGADGTTKLAPYNLVTTWFWVEKSAAGARPVPHETLTRAFFEGDRHHPDLVRALDRNGDGKLEGDELVLDTEAKVTVARSRLVGAGVNDPRISAEIQPFGLHHGIAPGRFATRDCDDCHARSSRLVQPFVLSARAPFGVVPSLLGGGVALPGPIVREADGALVLRTDPTRLSRHVFGLSHSRAIDTLGLLLVLGALLGALAHGTLRVVAARRKPMAEEAR